MVQLQSTAEVKAIVCGLTAGKDFDTLSASLHNVQAVKQTLSITVFDSN